MGVGATGMGAMGAAGVWSRLLAAGVATRASPARGVASLDATAGLVMGVVPLPGFGRECKPSCEMSARLAVGFEGDGLGELARDKSALVRTTGAGPVDAFDRARLKIGLGMGLGGTGVVVVVVAVDFDASPRVLTLRGLGDLRTGEVFALRLRSVPLGGAS